MEESNVLGARILVDTMPSDGTEEMDTAETGTMVQRTQQCNESSRSRRRSEKTSSADSVLQPAAACSKLVTYGVGAVLSLQNSETLGHITPEHAVIARAYQLQDFVCYLGNGVSNIDRRCHQSRHTLAIEEAAGLGLLESPSSPPKTVAQFNPFTLPSTDFSDETDVVGNWQQLSDTPEKMAGLLEEARSCKRIPFRSDSTWSLLGVSYYPSTPTIENDTESKISRRELPAQSFEQAVTIHGLSCKSSYAFSGDLAGKGAFGEAWRGFAMDLHGTSVVLKRLFLQLGKDIIREGMREVYFGQLMSSAKLTQHLARYTAHFKDDRTESFWIVYRDEGVSLYQCVFSVLPGPNPMMVPSALWETLREDPDTIKELLKGVLTGLRNLHQMSVTHRDVKLENVFVQPSLRLQNDQQRPFFNPKTARLGDFGSAVRAPSSHREKHVQLIILGCECEGSPLTGPADLRE
eukprot:8018746-Pyramimonas_sp.AAC.3